MRLLILYLVLAFPVLLHGREAGQSVYRQKPSDPYAVYFTPEQFGIRNDGSADVSDALQKAVNDLKKRDNFGIVFIPEGKYLISKTIFIPTAIRLIGYGKTRPEIVLAENSPGFQIPAEGDKGQAGYMFWFTSSVVGEDKIVRDANAGTFYSALSNINLTIRKGNPCAVALRTHYAQHSFISHCDIRIGEGKAGIFDVGNEIENVRFFGGEYGIYTTKTSPSWQFTMLNTYFEGQRKAAVRTQEGGFVVRRMYVKNSPVVFDIDRDRHDKLYLEDCFFDNISEAAVVVSRKDLSPNQLCIRRVSCEKVPAVILFRETGETLTGASGKYVIDDLSLGIHMACMGAVPEFKLVCEQRPVKTLSGMGQNDIPAVPDMEKWANIVELGAVGDGETDNTGIFRDAISKYDVIYVPQGDYLISGTLKLRPSTALIGLNPISTQIILKESTPEFSGFGSPVPMLETPKSGTNFISGIGINAGGYNYRAVGVKWMAGEKSYLNDVKFLGVHGTMKRPGKESAAITRVPAGVSSPDKPVAYLGKDKAWDNQYWSLWITDGGGGVFKDIWSADTYASSGILVSDTSTPGRMYEISVEHHVRNEVTFKNVSNWNIYALQLEEEFRESADVSPIELQNCHNLLFANLYLFRVIWVDTPLPYAVRTWGDCSGIEFYNVHNFTQMRFTSDFTIYDINKKLKVLPWEFTRLTIRGDEKRQVSCEGVGYREIASGFEYIEGLASDSKGNVYFSEQRMKRIYKWSSDTGLVSLVCDFPWQILSLGCDTEDNLLVCVKYYPQPGNMCEPKVQELPDREGTTFSWWGNSGFEPRFFSVNPDRPESTFTVMEKVLSSSVDGVEKYLYPAHRWRDLHDFDEVSESMPEYSFKALDGKTMIPEFYDLLRSSSLVPVVYGVPSYTVDEYNHRTVRSEMGVSGKLEKTQTFSNVGDFCAVASPDGKVYVTDGYIYEFTPQGTLVRVFELPLRPASMVFGGKDRSRLIVAARSVLYECILNSF